MTKQMFARRHRHIIVVVAAVLGAALPAAADDRYGAISYARDSAIFAVALDRTTRAEAEADALARCRLHDRNCATPVWVMNGCVAIALGKGHGYGSGWGSTRDAAEREAMGVCIAKAHACSVQHTACTTGH